jgi:hypothetical protein
MLIQNNESFERMSEKLFEKGVKDYEFILRNNNPKLNGIDPYDKKSFRGKNIIDEITSNVWYFLREVVRINTLDDGLVPFNINLINLETLFLLENGADVYLTSPRQTFGTITLCVYMLWKAYTNTGNPKFKYSFTSSNNYSTNLMFDRIKSLIKFPDYICKDLSSYVDYKFVTDYIPDIDFLFIDDFEFMKNNDINNVLKILKAKRDGKINTQIVFKSSLGHEKSLGRRIADDIAKTSHKFEYFLFDNPEFIQKNELYYVIEDIEELMPKINIDKIKKILNNDKDTIKRELLCDRCKDYEIR